MALTTAIFPDWIAVPGGLITVLSFVLGLGGNMKDWKDLFYGDNSKKDEKNSLPVQTISGNVEQKGKTNIIAGRIDQFTVNEILPSSPPDLRVVGGQLINGKKIEVIVKNYGQTTAESVSLHVYYSYAPEIMLRIRELPPSEKYSFVFDVFPLAQISDFQKEYKKLIEKFNAQEKALVIRLNLEFTWNEKIFSVKEYTQLITLEHGQVVLRLV